MLTYVTGAIDSGKTSLMQRLSEELKDDGVDGILCPKSYFEGEFIGYGMVRAGSSTVVPLAILEASYRGSFAESFYFDRFVFNVECFALGARIVAEAISREDVRHVFVDEVGPLELEGKGFKGIVALLSRNVGDPSKEFYIGVRESCLAQLHRALGSPQSRLIRP
ncbi:MAG TPA: nucleoside-triphosphatase [Bacillota bacterium]|nr:hypothetical protein [Bacillota bacterium]HOA15526.1 nucleoside-triphosphatase [Bacillota bacterium]HOG52447.1 nucleoside-triphosphatase [Bacillota bacterium]